MRLIFVVTAIFASALIGAQNSFTTPSPSENPDMGQLNARSDVGNDNSGLYIGAGYYIFSSDLSYESTRTRGDVKVSSSGIEIDNTSGVIVGYNLSSFLGMQMALSEDQVDHMSGQIAIPIWDRVSPFIDVGLAHLSLVDENNERYSWADIAVRLGAGVDIYFKNTTLQIGYYSYEGKTFDLTDWARSQVDSDYTSAAVEVEATSLEFRYLYNF
ncbi:MAG: hypothetical protein ISN29_01400 [Gammaproteobacteria bacterium AqS3]|nr:hypothetical protein [Gammaproteobacteria bacterium AqS3]